MTEQLAEASATSIDDATLVARAKREVKAFAPLYVRYYDRVYAYCYRRLGNPDDAADATSLIFSRVLAALSSCRDESFRSWLFSIAHNVLADYYRTRKIDRPIDDAFEVADHGPSPEDEAIAAEAKATVTKLLAELPEEQRAVLELRLAGLTSKEIAAVLGKQPNAVDQAQFRAMTRLKLLAQRAGSWTEGPK
jgi:RNA polymerase sigma-70 factor (ECF subfamily)